MLDLDQEHLLVERLLSLLEGHCCLINDMSILPEEQTLGLPVDYHDI